VDERVWRYGDLARDLLATPGDIGLVGIDGCGAAGKTTFAARLAQAAGDAPVVHTDDFASWDEPTQWWPRMLAEVIEPLLSGNAASYRPYDWVQRRLAEDVVTIQAAAPLVVIEGVGATRRAWRDRLVRRIWMDTSREERLRRGLERDGDHMREFWEWWMAAEDRYVQEEQPDRYADIRVSGEPSMAHDPEREFVQVGPVVSERR
jgi:uridine kinase